MIKTGSWAPQWCVSRACAVTPLTDDRAEASHPFQEESHRDVPGVSKRTYFGVSCRQRGFRKRGDLAAVLEPGEVGLRGAHAARGLHAGILHCWGQGKGGLVTWPLAAQTPPRAVRSGA